MYEFVAVLDPLGPLARQVAPFLLGLRSHTLVSYRIGRWAPSHRYPYGYGSASLSPPLPPLSFSNEPADSPTFSSQSSNRSGRSSSRSSSLQLQPASVRPRALLVLYRNADSPS